MKHNILNPKIVPIITILFFFLILVSADDYCTDGNKGKLEIVSIEDNLQDNEESWKWLESQEVELKIKIKNNLERKINATIEIIFVDEDNNKTYIANSNIKKTQRISEENTKNYYIEVQLDDSIPIGTYQMKIKAYEENNESSNCEQKTKSVKIGSLENQNSEEINLIEIEDISDNEEEYEWLMLDEAELELKINATEERDYEIELIFYKSGKEIEITEDNLEIEKHLKEGENTINITFDIKDDLEEGKYGLLIIIKGNEEKRLRTYEDSYGYISIKNQGTVIELTECDTLYNYGDKIKCKLKIKNVGDYQDKIKVHVYNKDLKIVWGYELEKVESGSSKELTFQSNNIYQNGTYIISIFTEYDYVNESGYYRTYSDDSRDKKIKIVIKNNQETKQEKVKEEIESTLETPKENEELVESAYHTETEPNLLIYIVFSCILIILGIITFILGKKNG